MDFFIKYIKNTLPCFVNLLHKPFTDTNFLPISSVRWPMKGSEMTSNLFSIAHLLQLFVIANRQIIEAKNTALHSEPMLLYF